MLRGDLGGIAFAKEIRMLAPTPDELKERYTYRPPTTEEINLHGMIDEVIVNVAKRLVSLTPCCRDQSSMLTALDEVRFRAHAAVARTAAGTAPSQT